MVLPAAAFMMFLGLLGVMKAMEIVDQMQVLMGQFMLSCFLVLAIRDGDCDALHHFIHMLDLAGELGNSGQLTANKQCERNNLFLIPCG